MDPSKLLDFEQEESDFLPQGNELSDLSGLVRQRMELAEQIAELEEQLKGKKAQLRHIEQNLIPDMFFSAGIQKFTTTEGMDVQVKRDLVASIPKERKSEVCTWLMQHEHGGIVRHELHVPFGKGKDDEVKHAREVLNASGFQFFEIMDVHTGSLKSLLKKLLEKGEEIDLPFFGAEEINQTKIKMP